MTAGQGWSGAKVEEPILKEQVMENKKNSRSPWSTSKCLSSSMVLFMVKWAVASIPALILLFILGFFLLGLAGATLPSMFKFFIKSLLWGCQ